jgi:replication-associated recombination protein RarA
MVDSKGQSAAILPDERNWRIILASSYDPWQQCKTKNGLPADQVISALQKEIRRNNVDNAAVLAYEMLITSRELEDFLWLRLQVISVEDIGFGDLQAPLLIQTLQQMRLATKPESNDRYLFAIHAVRYLCSRMKDRSSDEMLNWIKKSYEKKELVPQIPDYALDKHTLAGQKLERGDREFYREGASVSPEYEKRDLTYLKRLQEMLGIG